MSFTKFQEKDGDTYPSQLLSCRVIARTQSLPSSLQNYNCVASSCIDKRLICLTHPKKGIQTFQSTSDTETRCTTKRFEKEIKGVETFWNWDVHNLSRIPMLFPIERTHEVVKDSSPETVSHNISKLLQEESISVEYDNDNAIAYAENQEGLKFHIRLFQSNESTCGDRNRDILVEIQRRHGCSVAFHNIAIKILHAARGQVWKPRNIFTSLPFHLPPNQERL